MPQYRVSGKTRCWKMSRAAAFGRCFTDDFKMTIRFLPQTELRWNSADLTVPPHVAGIFPQ
jgi:hypothetical protein